MKHKLFLPLFLGLIFWSVLFVYFRLEGDIAFFLLHQVVTKFHLLHSFEIPYFTPAFCGGFLLAADPQSTLFTVYQFIGLFMENQYFSIQLGHVVVSAILFLGLYFWFEDLGLKDSQARGISALLITVSGFWVVHLKWTHLGLHGLCYVPWLLSVFEKQLDQNRTNLREHLRLVLIEALLIFLILNSGYVPILVLIPLGFGRLIPEIFREKGALTGLSRGMFLIAIGVGFGFLLSLPRLGAVISMTLYSFPREIGIYGNVRENIPYILTIVRGLFDPRVLTDGIENKLIGGFWEWGSYVGLSTVPFFLGGVWALRGRDLQRSLKGLFWATIIALVMLRTGVIARVLRLIFPFLNGLTWFNRYFFILTVAYMILVGFGLEMLLKKKFLKSWSAGLILLIVLVDLGLVYSKTAFFASKPIAELSAPYISPNNITQVAEKGTYGVTNPHLLLARGLAIEAEYCPTPIVGYNRQNYLTKTKAGPIAFDGNGTDFNMNDLFRIFSREEPSGKFMTNEWPLWPLDRRAELLGFLNFKQVVPLPQRAKNLVALGEIAWLVFLVLFTFLLRSVFRPIGQRTTDQQSRALGSEISE